MMISAIQKQRILDKLTSASRQLEEAVTQSVPAARYDPVVVVPQSFRDELAALRNVLNRMIRSLEEYT
jgi:hypothetical protein